MLKTLALSLFMLSMVSIIPSTQVYAASGVGRIVHTYGPAWIERGDNREKVRKGRVVLRNDSIITGPRGRVKLIMGDGSKVYVGAKSRISLRKYSMRGKRLLHASIHMLWGKARFFVNKLASRDSTFRVRTSTAVLGVRGTEFSVWSPPTPEILSRAFDKITLADIPPLPTRTVLMEGAVDVDTGTGIQYRLTPGNTADVDSSRRVRVRKTNNEDLEETSRPLTAITAENSDNKSKDNDQPKAEAQPTAKKNAAEKSSPEKQDQPEADDNKPTSSSKQPKGKTDEKQGTADSPSATKAEASPKSKSPTKTAPTSQPAAKPAVEKATPAPAALPDNPQSSDAASIMLGGDANIPLDQPSMPAPPAVAAPAAPTSVGNIQTQGKKGNKQGSKTNSNNAPAGSNANTSTNNPAAAPTAPAPAALPMGGGIPIDTQATVNAIQNLGTTSDITIAPNFVKP